MVPDAHHGQGLRSGRDTPSLGNLQGLVVLDLLSNNMVGSFPPEIGNLKAVTKMDLLMNQFSNRIPRDIGGLQNLALLSLRNNKLQGSIPESMNNMVGLEFLDLSHNNISGNIPKSLEKFQNLKYFNVSVNKLYGEMPPEGPFKNLSNQFFIHNDALCGSSRFSFPPCPTSSKYRRGKSAPQQADSLSTVAKERISYYELLRETNVLSESNLIGSKNFGSVFKGVLRSGTFIAVKVFNLQLDALVLEYMPNGSLEKYLYLHNYFLDIRQRLSIMIDVACALEYLHHGCSSRVIHCDLKRSNVLLDEDMFAHLSDFGISKLLGEDQGDLYTKTLATLGYIAPMRKPNEFEGDLSLKQWVSYSLPTAVMDVVDANMVTAIGKALQKELHVVASTLKVALDCCAESPARRTNIIDVVVMLQNIKIQLLAR
ncbi:hypothetical protein P3S68_003007 [Capsicum galapagoense]